MENLQANKGASGKIKDEVKEESNLKNREWEDTNDDHDSEHESRKRKRSCDLDTEEMNISEELRAEHDGRESSIDLRTLFVRFPKSLRVTSGEQVLNLVKEAVDVRLPRSCNPNYYSHCLLEFESEDMTERMKEKISKMKVQEHSYYVDYVGKKSDFCSSRVPKPMNPCKLYVGGVHMETTRLDLKNVFPTAMAIEYGKKQKNGTTRFAFITYKKEEDALKVFESSKNLKINGKEVTVMFAKGKKTTGKMRGLIKENN